MLEIRSRLLVALVYIASAFALCIGIMSFGIGSFFLIDSSEVDLSSQSIARVRSVDPSQSIARVRSVDPS
ncbi:MAG: hypothetical protein KUG78_21600, partial [Kangiellaceae bacterium]|nr:hypothetical protein [Kangiellaceae bacterium]